MSETFKDIQVSEEEQGQKSIDQHIEHLITTSVLTMVVASDRFFYLLLLTLTPSAP